MFEPSHLSSKITHQTVYPGRGRMSTVILSQLAHGFVLSSYQHTSLEINFHSLTLNLHACVVCQVDCLLIAYFSDNFTGPEYSWT